MMTVLKTSLSSIFKAVNEYCVLSDGNSEEYMMTGVAQAYH